MSEVRFIRKNGRIIPIRAKKGTAREPKIPATRKKNPVATAGEAALQLAGAGFLGSTLIDVDTHGEFNSLVKEAAMEKGSAGKTKKYWGKITEARRVAKLTRVSRALNKASWLLVAGGLGALAYSKYRKRSKERK